MKSAATVLAVAILTACGGDVTVNPDGGGGDGSGAAPTNGGASSDGGSVANSVGGGNVSTGGASAQGGSSSTANGGSSAQGGAGTGGGTGEVINCGMISCDAATEQCCGTQQGTSCIATGDPCQGITLDCSSAANCDNGQICCLTGGMGMASAQCADMCGGGGPGGGLQLCAENAECPPGIDCVEVFGGFTACDPGFGGP